MGPCTSPRDLSVFYIPNLIFDEDRKIDIYIIDELNFFGRATCQGSNFIASLKI